MSRIRGRDTQPELRLRQALWQLGLRYRTSLRVAGVRPDIVFLGRRLAVFVDGCFWHGCPEHYTRPRSTTTGFWALKLTANTKRDEQQTQRLVSEGWRVVRVWEHEIDSDLNRVVQLIADTLNGAKPVQVERWVVVSVTPSADAEDEELFHLRELLTGHERIARHHRRPRGNVGPKQV